ncbi:MAG TPA: histidine phosphatase family protein [Pilimelia sp.]|nr:histidine phosphatase family protein [Pilimelia sp.]
MPAELVVVRHGESTANAAFAVAEAAGLVDSGITGRDADVPLSPLGRAQARGLGRWLAGLSGDRFPEVVLCSPYRRARQTLEIAFDELRAAGRAVPEPIVDARLRDRETGELELLTSTAIRRRFPAEAARRAATGEFDYRPPGGESMMDVAARLRELYGDVAAEFAGRRVFAVAHDAVVLMLRHVVEGLSPQDLDRVVAAGPVRNASVTRWVRDGDRLGLREYNMVPENSRAGGDGG